MSRRWIAASAVLLAAGGAMGCRSAPAAPPPEPAPAPPPPSIIVDPLRICVVKDGRMSMVEGVYIPATGDTTVGGRSFHEAYPVTSEYASQARWYWDNVPIAFGTHRYIKYGLPRSLAPTDVEPVGSYEGVPVFAEPGQQGLYDVLYLPVSPGCTFQPYQAGEIGGAVRG